MPATTLLLFLPLPVTELMLLFAKVSGFYPSSGYFSIYSCTTFTRGLLSALVHLTLMGLK